MDPSGPEAPQEEPTKLVSKNNISGSFSVGGNRAIDGKRRRRDFRRLLRLQTDKGIRKHGKSEERRRRRSSVSLGDRSRLGRNGFSFNIGGPIKENDLPEEVPASDGAQMLLKLSRVATKGHRSGAWKSRKGPAKRYSDEMGNEEAEPANPSENSMDEKQFSQFLVNRARRASGGSGFQTIGRKLETLYMNRVTRKSLPKEALNGHYFRMVRKLLHAISPHV